MTKDQLMNYSWSRDFNYSDLMHVAGMMTDVELPTEQEYQKYGKKAFEDMLKFLDKEYEDAQATRARVRTELGWDFVGDFIDER